MNRPYWIQEIHRKLARKNVLWLSGVRRVGKTTLCKALTPDAYYDCELPRIRGLLEDPEYFFKSQSPSKLIVLDEIHRLLHPSEILKIAADHFPRLKVVATGSSTLAARSKFGDILTDRKKDLWLTPVLVEECSTFGINSLDARVLRGGLPGRLIHTIPKSDDDKFYSEWLEQFWVRDVEELFKIEKRYSFLKFSELLLSHSGDLFEATAFSGPCEVSRQTIYNYLSALEIVHFAHVVRPFFINKTKEIISQPKVYTFDTGFVCYFKGIDSLRGGEKGLLLEHLTLNEIQGVLQRKDIYFWRDKAKHEIDFVLQLKPKAAPIGIECKWNYREFDDTNLKHFRNLHPHGKNIVVCANLHEPLMLRTTSGLEIHVVPITQLGRVLRTL